VRKVGDVTAHGDFILVFVLFIVGEEMTVG